ncbi:isoleucine--tRNA ligase [Chloroflexota bacterium]
MFNPVSSRVSFPEIEEKILSWWKSDHIFERSVEVRKDGPRFMLNEGPPTANGNPGIHHVLARIFKDVIPRYKVMKGYYAPRIAGWDTHGLPVELEVEKELGFSGKAQIEEYGIDKFNARCRESVFRYLKEWNELTERIGFWIDLEHPYITMDNNYIESVWWTIKNMWGKGLVYQGYKVTPHCPRCGTSLSSHEVALGYKDNTEDPSVYIKFKVTGDNITGVKGDKPTYLLAWTTTPWTLPGNTAVAVAPESEYVLLENDNEYLVMASLLVEVVGMENYQIVEKIEGKKLVGIRYEPLFNPHNFGVERQKFQDNSGLQSQQDDKNLTYQVIGGDFVSMEDGTGIVHIAPSYGEIDYEAGKDHGLDFVHTVDLQGNIIGNYPFSGKFVKEADPLVLEDLRNRGLLFRSETIKHTYPFCWRCESPLLYYAKQTWYIRTTAVKDSLVAGNEEINWYPEHIKHGRFGDWLKNNIDWAFSRERYWGTPLPVWGCGSCGYLDCIGSLDELKGKDGFTGFREPLDLHRSFIDEVTYNCSQCGGQMKRVPEVIDCWFDSGAMPIAQYHYPFENKNLLEDGRFPADYICEAIDQTRGWFYSQHAISTLLFGRTSFRNCICLGHILDAKGEKMSKAKKNVVKPSAVIDKYGADALRWYLFTSSAPGNVRRFDEKLVAEVSRRVLSTLWNVYSFFVIYANIDEYVPVSEVATPSESELDRWIISELNQLIADVDSGLENYNPTEAGRKIDSFVDGLSNWYVRRSRRRFWKSENDTDKVNAYSTLYQCLVTLSKLMAPLTPFIAEELYQNLVRSVFTEAPESVHLADFPVADETRIDKALADAHRLAMKVSSMGRAARSKAGIKVRQPLQTNYIGVSSEGEKLALKMVEPLIMEELNVKEVEYDTVENVATLEGKGYAIVTEGASNSAISTIITPHLEAEGMARELVHGLQTMRRAAGFDIADHIIAYYEEDAYMIQVISSFSEYIKQETLARELIGEIPEGIDFKETYKLCGRNMLLGVKRVV